MSKKIHIYIFILSFIGLFSSCIQETITKTVCESPNQCFSITLNMPFDDAGESGIVFNYGITGEKDVTSLVHLRNSVTGFYYRWEKDTLFLRCPYWKVVKDLSSRNPKFNFKNDFTEEEKLKYGFRSDDFYNNVRKDFKESVTGDFY